MKFLCIVCDEPMKLESSEGPEEGSMTITFGCPKCKVRVALLTNPHETQLVKSLDVCIGGHKTQSEPLGFVRKTMEKRGGEEDEGKSEIIWTKEAEKRLENVPTFVRPMARMGVENYAREKGYREITVKVMEEAREKMGM